MYAFQHSKRCRCCHVAHNAIELPRTAATHYSEHFACVGSMHRFNHGACACRFRISRCSRPKPIPPTCVLAIRHPSAPSRPPFIRSLSAAADCRGQGRPRSCQGEGGCRAQGGRGAAGEEPPPGATPAPAGAAAPPAAPSALCPVLGLGFAHPGCRCLCHATPQRWATPSNKPPTGGWHSVHSLFCISC